MRRHLAWLLAALTGLLLFTGAAHPVAAAEDLPARPTDHYYLTRIVTLIRKPNNWLIKRIVIIKAPNNSRKLR